MTLRTANPLHISCLDYECAVSIVMGDPSATLETLSHHLVIDQRAARAIADLLLQRAVINMDRYDAICGDTAPVNGAELLARYDRLQAEIDNLTAAQRDLIAYARRYGCDRPLRARAARALIAGQTALDQSPDASATP